MRFAGDWAPRDCLIDPLPWDGLTIANLEGPVISQRHAHYASPKSGPHLSHSTLPDGPNEFIWALANNHFMDFGQAGLSETLQVLVATGMQYVGAGQDLAAASRPLVIMQDGMRIGILSRCEVQFGIATDRRPGVAPLDATVYRAIGELKQETDVVIASIHAAAEMCPWPSSKRQDAWRALIEAGADVVHGHHAHVPQGWETYEGGLIFYGLGNLCVDPQKWVQHPNAFWSLAPELSWTGGRLSMQPLTAVIEDRGDSVRVRDASPAEVTEHHGYLAECNRPLSDRRLLEGLWQEASVRMYRHHFAGYLGFEGSKAPGLRRCTKDVLRRLGRKMGLDLPGPAPRKVIQAQYLLWYHLFACDSHNDAIATALGVLGDTLEDLRCDETAGLVDQMMPSM